MLIFLNPKQYFLQAQIADPDGWRKYDEKLEEEYVARILKARQAKNKEKKRKKLTLKQQVEERLDAGTPEEVILQEVDTEALQAEVSAIIAEYQATLMAEIKAIAEQEYNNTLAAVRAIAEEEHRIRLEEQRVTLERERKRKLRARRMKVLILLASMDDDDE